MKDIKITSKEIEQILEQLEKNTRTDIIRIRTKTSEEPLSLTASKFGGVPYIENFENYPRAPYEFYPNGEKMMLTLLAQINFSDLPKNNIFPDKGLLQFFILNSTDTKNYQVVFYKDIGTPPVFLPRYIPTSLMPFDKVVATQNGKQITADDVFWLGEGFPIYGELALEFSLDNDTANMTEDSFEEEFRKAAEELDILLPEEIDSIYYLLPEEERNIVFDDRYYDGGHKILGHPTFTQYDSRSNPDDMLLFQIDSAWSNSGETNKNNFIVIGDAGIIRFFISKEDLKNLNFSHVEYDWDCC